MQLLSSQLLTIAHCVCVPHARHCHWDRIQIRSCVIKTLLFQCNDVFKYMISRYILRYDHELADESEILLQLDLL